MARGLLSEHDGRSLGSRETAEPESEGVAIRLLQPNDLSEVAILVDRGGRDRTVTTSRSLGLDHRDRPGAGAPPAEQLDHIGAERADEEGQAKGFINVGLRLSAAESQAGLPRRPA